MSRDETISGHSDPTGEAPWAMQLVVRVEKTAPPTRTAACEAAAMAAVRLLDHDEARGDWRPAVERWMAGRIRKHVRRARGARWERAAALPGVTVTHDGAQVRAFVPGPTDAIPSELARLQLSGLELADPAPRADAPGGALVVVSLQPDPRLGDGKAAAACGHAAQLAWMRAPGPLRARWVAQGMRVAVEQPAAQRFAELVARAPVVVRGAGLTEVDPGTVTAVARWA